MGWFRLWLATIAFSTAPLSILAADFLPPASNVVARVLERAHAVAHDEPARRYAYDKRAVTSELDANDRIIKSTEKMYRVVLIGGLPFQRLVKLQGRELTGKELEKENQREVAFRQRISGVDLNKKAARKEGLVTDDLIRRFDFAVLRREPWRDRSALVVKFTPKPSAASDKSIEDKLLSRISGLLWVDEQEFEVARVDAAMAGPINLGWFGAIGSLQQCTLSLERQRLADGVWANAKSQFFIAGRKLFSAMRMRIVEESSGFRREAAKQIN